MRVLDDLTWIAVLVCITFFATVVGYYAGYRMAYQMVLEQCSAEALSDQVAAAIYTAYPQEPEQGEESESESTEESEESEEED